MSISGVSFVLFAETLTRRSSALLTWTMLFLGANLLYTRLIEEPMLVLRFGTAYREYARHVPRIVPRSRPWRGETG